MNAIQVLCEAMFNISNMAAGTCLLFAVTIGAPFANAEPQTLSSKAIRQMLSTCAEIDGMSENTRLMALADHGYLPISAESASAIVAEWTKSKGEIIGYYLNSPSTKQEWHDQAAQISKQALKPRLAETVVSATSSNGTLLLVQSPDFLFQNNGTMVGLAHSCDFYVNGWVERHAMAKTLENFLDLEIEYRDTPPADWGYVRSRSSRSQGAPYISIVASAHRSVPDLAGPQIEISLSVVHDTETPTKSILLNNGVAD